MFTKLTSFIKVINDALCIIFVEYNLGEIFYLISLTEAVCLDLRSCFVDTRLGYFFLSVI